MGLWNVLSGRSSAPRPNLDSLFALPGAAITLQTSLGLTPTGAAAVCYRAAEGLAASATVMDAVELVSSQGGPQVHQSLDSFGFTWLVFGGDPADVGGLVTDLHAINTSLEGQGFAEGLLCSMLAFADANRRKANLVYLYKQGSFYPFAPNGPQSRDTLLERQIRDAVESDLRIEPDQQRWLPVWGAPL